MTRVLVVEDNPMNMELVTFILTAGGIEVMQAFDGPEALDKIRNNCFDLILLDIQLPGMDGIEVIRNINNIESMGAPIIALTAHAMQGDEQKFISAGCSGYISKPIDVPTFVGKVLSYVSAGGK
ncbi:response regulator [Methanolobus chelungpuianus]|uniref:Chemotaxis protein CheY n=1 Tax=Methanolobus chelungpuianus TaxID=502115 RepID=A0AAE3H978_9EURY|nr:response regulator [Methanolobus chelungpuianus]MCQ6961932.1 chemotaxis protein CheY [Methanolobus chelungpuianus]